MYIYIYSSSFQFSLTSRRKHNLRVEFETTFGEKLSDGDNLKENNVELGANLGNLDGINAPK
jgi:hypothetical protein